MVMAERRLIIGDLAGDKEVVIRLYQPEAKDGTWSCRFEIDWPNQRRLSRAGGVDSMQALVLALQAIGIEIYSSSYHKSGLLKWYEPTRGYGFPVSYNVRDLLIGDDQKL
jgi:hypothetical protein